MDRWYFALFSTVLKMWHLFYNWNNNEVSHTNFQIILTTIMRILYPGQKNITLTVKIRFPESFSK